jgi:hypothetical protein
MIVVASSSSSSSNPISHILVLYICDHYYESIKTSQHEVHLDAFGSIVIIFAENTLQIHPHKSLVAD